MRRRNLDADSTEVPAGNTAFEHVLIDPMNNDEEEDKDRQFVTALARGLELLRCFTPSESVLGNQELARKTGLPKPTIRAKIVASTSTSNARVRCLCSSAVAVWMYPIR